jgi:hypothetical protein
MEHLILLSLLPTKDPKAINSKISGTSLCIIMVEET